MSEMDLLSTGLYKSYVQGCFSGFQSVLQCHEKNYHCWQLQPHGTGPAVRHLKSGNIQLTIRNQIKEKKM